MHALQLAVVIPIYNEQENIERVLTEWIACFERVCPHFELLALNDGSRDQTGPILDALAERIGPRLRVIHKANSGHGRTCRAGYDLAVESGAEWVLQLDSDGQCDPAYFEGMWRERGKHDCIFGFRNSRGDGMARLLVSRACRALLFATTGAWMRDANVPYRLMRRRALQEALPIVPPDFDIHNIALTYALKCLPEIRWQYQAIHFRPRQGGENSIDLRKIARMGWGMLRDFSRVREAARLTTRGGSTQGTEPATAH